MKSSPDVAFLTWQGSLAPQADGSKICPDPAFPRSPCSVYRSHKTKEAGGPGRRSPQSPSEFGK